MRTRSSTKKLKAAETASRLKVKTCVSTQRAHKPSCPITTTVTPTSLETNSPEVQPPPSSSDIHVSGSSLNTRSFSLANLIEELGSIESEIWGIDPTNPDELSDDPDDDDEDESAHGGILNKPLTGYYGHNGARTKRAQGRGRRNPTKGYYIKELRRKIAMKVKHAKATRTVFSTFSYADAVGPDEKRRQRNTNNFEVKRTVWCDGKARVGYSNDGIPIVYHIPGAISKPTHDKTFDILMKMGKHVKLELGGGADGSGRNTKESYRIRKGEISGILKLVLLWHAIGHPHEAPVISRDYIRTGAQFSATTNAISRISLLSHAVNAIIKEIDPAQYNALRALREKCLAQHPFLKALSSLDPLVMEGRAIQYNRQTPLHPDRQDPFKSWATMITFGKFTVGGELRVPRLNLEMRYLPRDAVIIRGRLLPHEVKAWGPGQRLSIAHFTHDSLWKSYGVECP